MSNPFLATNGNWIHTSWRCPIELAFWHQHIRARYVMWLASYEHHPDGLSNGADVAIVAGYMTFGDDLYARCRAWLNDHPDTLCPNHPDGHGGLLPADFDDLGDGTLPSGILDFTCGGPDAMWQRRCKLHQYVWQRRRVGIGFTTWTEGDRSVHPGEWYSSEAPYTGAALQLYPWWDGIGWAPRFNPGPVPDLGSPPALV